MLQGRNSIRLQGTRMVEVQTGGNTRRYYELVLRDGPRMRIEFPKGSPFEGQIVVDDGVKRLTYNPKTRATHESPAKPEDGIIKRLAGKGLSVKIEPGGRIAGYQTQQIEARSPQGALLLRAWVDPTRGAILKRELYDAQGRRIALSEFTEVRFGVPIPPGSFTIDPRDPLVDDLQRACRTAGFEPVRLPENTGYRLKKVQGRTNGRIPMVTQTYAGNGTRLSLILVGGTVDPNRLKKFSNNKLNSITWRTGMTTAVLIGEVSDTELGRLSRMATR
jgi:outer membrane lipoprotein-sorting protein